MRADGRRRRSCGPGRGYRGAGTVEFIVDSENRHYFLK